MKPITDYQEEILFSGTAYAVQNGKVLHESSAGSRSRAEKTKNTIHTRYGIASGCKIFTSIAICQLAEQGKLHADTKLYDILEIEAPLFDKTITVHQLLTHTSGVPDYFDEEVMDDFEELWADRPVYQMRTPASFLPLFQNQAMKFSPGARFHYNNAGYILLGLIIEKVSGLPFSEYIETNIFQKAGMDASGYFESDALPEETAVGYIEQEDGTWKTNVFSIPAKGGPDGGAYVTAPDMLKLWQALMTHQLLGKEMTEKLLKPAVQDKGNVHYGYGVWMVTGPEGVVKYILMGYDPGVNFRSVYYPETDLAIAVCSNHSDGAYEITAKMEELLL